MQNLGLTLLTLQLFNPIDLRHLGESSGSVGVIPLKNPGFICVSLGYFSRTLFMSYPSTRVRVRGRVRPGSATFFVHTVLAKSHA